MNEIEILPVTKNEDITRTSQFWSYLYAYNLKTIRDIFVYCANMKEIDQKQLYDDLENNKIPPPKTVWVKKGIKRKERLRLEYIHASKYLGLIKDDENRKLKPNFDTLKNEKEIIVKENKNRIFSPDTKSKPLSEKEKTSLLKIILNYERARDFLRWFLDFSKFPNSMSFNIEDFKKKAQPIFVLGAIKKDSKGSEIIKREIDKKTWKIPSNRPEDYIRLVSYVFPKWFHELGVIDKIIIFPEFSDDKNLWHMYYPIKMSEKQFLSKDIEVILKINFLKDKNSTTVWIPELLYTFVKMFYCPVSSIKKALEILYKRDFSHFYLDRASILATNKVKRYRDSYIKVDGFYRSHLKLFRN